MIHNKLRLSFSLTRAFLILCLSIAFLSPRWDFLDAIDNQMLHFGSWLLPAPKTENDIYTVAISPDFMRDPKRIKTLRRILNSLKKNDAASVSLFLTHMPHLDYQHIEIDVDENSDMTDSKEWEPSLGELTKLAWTIDKNKVIIGQPAIKRDNALRLKYDNESYLDYLIGIVFTKPALTMNDGEQSERGASLYPSTTTGRRAVPLLWTSADNHILPSLALSTFKQVQRANDFDWTSAKGITLNTHLIRTDYAGSILSYSPSNQKILRSLDLDEVMSLDKEDIQNKIFLLGDNQHDLTSLSNHLFSLVSSNYYHTPAWANWMSKLSFLFVFVYLLFFVSKLEKHTGYLLSFILLSGALVFQYGLLLTQSVWLPLTGLYGFLLIGHLSVLLKKSNDAQMDALKLHTHDALSQLAQYQFKQNDHDMALNNLLKCSPTTDVLELMYDIGLGYERRRQYEKALSLYSDLNARSNNFKDVKQRLDSLLSISDNASNISSPLQTAKTLVMTNGLQLPMLGRYEVERELGRGAMGVVYLGKDPKINRQVAIKTLDFSQFSDHEIKSFKARFFREAEAAGRLNHPDIVTVYDVGEEDDLAFIAMDYVNGAPLSDYSKPNTLLPINQVYKIIAEVADALDYAHAQKIIHRDIKPGNIMYDIDHKKIKITDFGIARISDNAHTRTGSFMGSPSYMSPEQMLGSKVDGHADIYALGVSFYQLLTGHLPFKADSIGNLAHIIANDKHKAIRDIRSELPSSATRIINKALQKKPKDRYKTAKEMADAIRRGMPKAN